MGRASRSWSRTSPPRSPCWPSSSAAAGRHRRAGQGEPGGRSGAGRRGSWRSAPDRPRTGSGGCVKSVLVAATVSLIISLIGTPQAIRLFRKRGYGQEIREDGPKSHLTKRGTPTMGGAVIILATLAGYFVAHLAEMRGVHRQRPADPHGHDRTRRRRVRRRLHQGPEAAQSRPLGADEIRRAARVAAGLRPAGRPVS